MKNVLKKIKNLDLDNEKWCIENDTLWFPITLQHRPLTRWGILSTVSSMYDPLGLAFLLRGKRILQILCKKEIGWNDPISEETRLQWERWYKELPLLQQMENHFILYILRFSHQILLCEKAFRILLRPIREAK